jgi:hypothetical protein
MAPGGSAQLLTNPCTSWQLSPSWVALDVSAAHVSRDFGRSRLSVRSARC